VVNANPRRVPRKVPRKVLVKPWKVANVKDPRRDPRKVLVNIKSLNQ